MWGDLTYLKTADDNPITKRPNQTDYSWLPPKLFGGFPVVHLVSGWSHLVALTGKYFISYEIAFVTYHLFLTFGFCYRVFSATVLSRTECQSWWPHVSHVMITELLPTTKRKQKAVFSKTDAVLNLTFSF